MQHTDSFRCANAGLYSGLYFLFYWEGSLTGEPMPVDEMKNHLCAYKAKWYDAGIVDAFLEHLAETTTQTIRPAVEVAWSQLKIDMEIAKISYQDRVFLKGCPVTQKKFWNEYGNYITKAVSPLLSKFVWEPARL